MNKELLQYLNQEPIKIKRDDLEQALSWFSRLSFHETTNRDKQSYENLLIVTHKMRSLGIDDD